MNELINYVQNLDEKYFMLTGCLTSFNFEKSTSSIAYRNSINQMECRYAFWFNLQVHKSVYMLKTQFAF